MSKSICLLLFATFAALLFTTGCSASHSGSGSLPDSSVSSVWSVDPTSGSHELEGTLDDLKDSMFVLAGEDGSYFAFPFSSQSKPQGLDQVKKGDRVKVTYTGKLSQVAPFTGEVLTVEKCKNAHGIMALFSGK